METTGSVKKVWWDEDWKFVEATAIGIGFVADTVSNQKPKRPKQPRYSYIEVEVGGSHRRPTWLKL